MERKTTYFSWQLAKYVSQDVLFSFISGVTIFLLIMLMFQAIRLSEFVVVHQVSMKDVVKMSSYLMLTFLPIALPVAFLFSVLMGISRATSEGEILALQVSGLSLWQIFFPIFIFSALITGICTYASLYTVPKANRAFELLITRLSSERVVAQLKPGIFSSFRGLVFFAEQIIPLKSELKRVFIYDERDQEYPLAITAQAGVLRTSPETGNLTLRLSDGAIHVDRKNDLTKLQKINFRVYDINLELEPRADSWRDYSPQSYDFSQLRNRIRETVQDRPQNWQLLVELHRRFSLSFSCLVFAGLGFFIGVLSHRGVRSTAIILCLMVGLLYWIFYIGANALATSGWVWPWLAIWFPNVLFTGVTYVCYRRCAR